MKIHTRRVCTVVLCGALGVSTLAACGDSGGSGASGDGGKTVTLVTHSSFNVSPEVLKEFEKTSGYKVDILKGGDGGEVVNKAVLSKGNPQGDVLFGVDNTLLSRAVDNGLFTPYEAKGLENVLPQYRVDEKHHVTPVDSGDICVNYDRKYFADKNIEPPKTFDDLIKPEYKNLLVTENAATSSPGLGFLLGTAAEYGDQGWQDYWKKLKANGVKVVDGWEQAYNEEFSGSAGGKKAGADRPLVVSYASSPPVEVLGVKPEPEQAPTGVATGTCFRQIEFAGLLKGAKNEKGGKALIDFLISKKFQDDMPLQMFVNPVREGAQLPELFRKFGVEVEDPKTMDPKKITEHREDWVKSWQSLVLK
ncbi:thiamine ABC transporter substrate-binding protein [Streptomyces sp. B-S-A8]|uniref:Thiamine ABC transporter substrate-binding protein n=1 Tax=Streptomyces solicavernae TaxID=3043614 RepID=A0ABT6RV98_9ACTN|nr:thiamine ABC transporter substrate-binding protein [Streptomyces sp. B-S-A8]MDI3388377.1 thiamine ABC transporter substrate-binding protein [Streptomyces sp. B-S-A8]